MNDNYFDELFRKKLANYASPVPEDMWRRIKQKKDKGSGIIFLLAMLFLMLGGITSYFIMAVKPGTIKETLLPIEQQTSKTNLFHKQNLPDESKLTQSPAFANDRSHDITTTPTNQIKVSGDELQKRYDELTESRDLGQLDDQSPFHILRQHDLDKITFSEKETAERLTSIQTMQMAEMPDAGKQIIGSLSRENDEDSAGDTKKPDSSLKNLGTVKAGKKIRIEREPVITGIFMEVYGSPDIPMSKITSKNSNYLRQKDSTSQMQLSYTLGLRIGAMIGEHWTGKIGIQYSDINEKFSYLNSNAMRTVPVIETRTVTDGNGGNRTIVDTSNLLQVGKQYKLTYNHYKSIDIPLTLGYSIHGERVTTGFNTGMIFNLRTMYKGDILDSNLAPADINATDIYKNRTGMSLYFSLSLQAKLNSQLSLFTEPYLRYRLNNMTGGYQPFAQKINVGGLSIGLRYNFKN